jgi:uncharacterized protein YlxW (UPF0749 family)
MGAMQEAEEARDAALAAANTQAEAKAAELDARCQQLEGQLKDATSEMTAASEKASADKAELDKQLKVAQVRPPHIPVFQA